MKTLVIGRNEAGQRLDKYLRKYLPKAPDGFLYRMLRKKNITLNGQRASGGNLLKSGDLVKLFLSDDTILKFQSGDSFEGSGLTPSAFRDFDSRVLFEDPDILIYNKGAGMLVQPPDGKKTRRGAPSGSAGSPADESVADLLPRYLLQKGVYTPSDYEAFRPAPANRLDRNTSGLVLCGVSLPGLQELSKLLKTRRVQKYYLAVVCGRPEIKGTLRGYLKRDAGQNRTLIFDQEVPGSTLIETGFEVLRAGERFSYVRVELLTGRTHQIRAHLSALGHPVAGDPKYGNLRENEFLRSSCGVRRQLLHAYEVSFPEDCGSLSNLSGRTWKAPLPEDFDRVRRRFFEESSSLSSTKNAVSGKARGYRD